MRRLQIVVVCARSFPSPFLLVSQQPAQPQALRIQNWMYILRKCVRETKPPLALDQM